MIDKLRRKWALMSVEARGEHIWTEEQTICLIEKVPEYVTSKGNLDLPRLISDFNKEMNLKLRYPQIVSRAKSIHHKNKLEWIARFYRERDYYFKK